MQALDAAGKPVRGVRVVARRLSPAGTPLEEGGEWNETEADGRFEVRLAVGPWRFARIPEAGDEVPIADVVLAEGETKDLPLALPAR